MSVPVVEVCPPRNEVFLFWLRRAAYRILVPQPGIEPVPPAVEARSLNHWTTREVPGMILNSQFVYHYLGSVE